jgi:hypothetical protein
MIIPTFLIAYYWDIERFKDVDSFVGYMVMGANPEVSGTSHNRMKTDKARAEVKGKFFMLFLQSHKDSSPYKPLIDLLKYRLSFSQAVAWKVKKLSKEKVRLRSQLERARGHKPRTEPRDRSRLGVCYSWWWR